jgi:hypothetical protein
MANDERDNPEIRVPPPLIYLLPLVAGLLLDRRSHVAFAAQRKSKHRVAADRRRVAGLRVVPPNDAQRRRAGTHRRARAEANY